ncbi:hypothetical protein ACIOGT_38170 [Streptomyces microflavus]|uniref:hypothetical protein n=1 Tax=Streptomyces microflavus TaxID=1919 RepID=UPI00381636CA
MLRSPMAMPWLTVLSALKDSVAPGREETIARGAAALALKRVREVTTDDVLDIGLYEFGVVIAPQIAAAVLAVHRVAEAGQER